MRDKDYKINGIIYLLFCNTQEDLRYIGSTSYLVQRINTHKADYVKHPNIKIYKTIREHGGWDNWKFITLYKFNCNTKEELKKEEQKAIDKYGCNLNTYRAYNDEEYKIKKLKEYRQYYKLKKLQETEDNKTSYDYKKDNKIINITFTAEGIKKLEEE